MAVHDVDLACSEREFPRLGRALRAKGIVHELRPWHVLQARKHNLKVEFASMEHWMVDLPEGCDTVMIGGCVFKMVSLPGLRELYRRGLEATACQDDEGNRAKHVAIAKKYTALCSLSFPKG